MKICIELFPELRCIMKDMSEKEKKSAVVIKLNGIYMSWGMNVKVLDCDLIQISFNQFPQLLLS